MVSVLSRPQSAQPMFLAPMPVPVPLPMHHTMNMTVGMGMEMFKTSEFNASQFDLSLQQVTQVTQVQQAQGMSKAHSLMDLRLPGPGSMTEDSPRKSMSVVDFPLEKKRPAYTQSLDRRILRHHAYPMPPHAAQVEAFYVSGRLMNAYYPPFPNGSSGFMHGSDMYGRNINAFHPVKMKSRSKHSLASADSDDFQKYRDIAL